MNQDPGRVFISHTSSDAHLARELCGRLEAEDVRCWVSFRDVPVGTDYGAAIERAIEASGLLIVLMSAKAHRSGHVQRELDW